MKKKKKKSKESTKVEVSIPIFKVNGLCFFLIKKDLRLKLIRLTIILGILSAFALTIQQLFSLHQNPAAHSAYYYHQLINVANATAFMSNTSSVEWTVNPMSQFKSTGDSKSNNVTTSGYQLDNKQQQHQLDDSASVAIPSAIATTSSTASSNNNNKIRIIWGIMSHNLNLEEIQRRKVIRETYLSYFHQNNNNMSSTSSSRYDTICSLNDLIDGKVLYPEQCRLAYIFVLGNSNIHGEDGSGSGPSMLLEYNDSYPLTVVVNTTNSSIVNEETDIVILNIRENGNDGKSPTWFRYATSILNDDGGLLALQDNSTSNNVVVQFSYIFKSDSDNLLFPPLLLNFIDTKLPAPANLLYSLPNEPSQQEQPQTHKSSPPSAQPIPPSTLVYGGRIITKKQCFGGFTKIERCKSLIGPLWIGGGCYFLSTALAKVISDPKSPFFDQYEVKLPHEDMCISNFVYSYYNAVTNTTTTTTTRNNHTPTTNLQIISEPIRRNKPVYRKHPIKDVAKYRIEWDKFIQQDMQQRRRKQK